MQCMATRALPARVKLRHRNGNEGEQSVPDFLGNRAPRAPLARDCRHTFTPGEMRTLRYSLG